MTARVAYTCCAFEQLATRRRLTQGLTQSDQNRCDRDDPAAKQAANQWRITSGRNAAGATKLTAVAAPTAARAAPIALKRGTPAREDVFN